jgi:twitching motility two-component system response regulator PilH
MSKILIVDDLATEVQMMKATVTKLGHHVIEAGDGDTGFNLAKKEQPDLILLDVVLPKADGFSVCRRLKKDPETAHIPVIMISTKSQESDQFWGLKQGADAYLFKPAKAEELAEVVTRSLAAAV